MPDLATIIDKARKITGNVMDSAVGETYIPADAIEVSLTPIIRDLNAVYGNAAGLKELLFTATPGQQDYPLSTLGNDIYEVQEVIRSGAFLPNQYLGIDQGLQSDAMEAILNQWRGRLRERFAWEVVNEALRLMPVPLEPEVVSVRYLTSGFTINTLPPMTEIVLVHAACVAILNAVINRTGSDRHTADAYGQAQNQRLRSLLGQRDYYQGQFEKEYTKLAN